jgi:hypothetical protein
MQGTQASGQYNSLNADQPFHRGRLFNDAPACLHATIREKDETESSLHILPCMCIIAPTNRYRTWKGASLSAVACFRNAKVLFRMDLENTCRPYIDFRA